MYTHFISTQELATRFKTLLHFTFTFTLIGLALLVTNNKALAQWACTEVEEYTTVVRTPANESEGIGFGISPKDTVRAQTWMSSRSGKITRRLRRDYTYSGPPMQRSPDLILELKHDWNITVTASISPLPYGKSEVSYPNNAVLWTHYQEMPASFSGNTIGTYTWPLYTAATAGSRAATLTFEFYALSGNMSADTYTTSRAVIK
jgi:hypothetical protein